jgi:hypothetical protein
MLIIITLKNPVVTADDACETISEQPFALLSNSTLILKTGRTKPRAPFLFPAKKNIPAAAGTAYPMLVPSEAPVIPIPMDTMNT